VQESAHELLRSVWDGAGPRLSRLICALGIAPGHAEDILQDVYLTAWRKAPPDMEAEDLRRWLMRVAINRCHLEHRRRARWRNVLRALTLRRGGDSPDGAVEAVARDEQAAVVRRALGRLPHRLRSILVLRYFAELDSKEIGQILQMPDATVRSHLRTGRQRLAIVLKRAGCLDQE
jgi:RNA polymerase sigma-70 factor (ECF subfamily)